MLSKNGLYGNRVLSFIEGFSVLISEQLEEVKERIDRINSIEIDKKNLL